MNDDQEHLRLLSVFHFVVAGIVALTGCLPFIHLVVGIAILAGLFPDQRNGPFSQALMGYLFIIIAVIAIAAAWSLAVCLFYAARFIHQRRHYTFCLIVGGLECLFMPLGTILGVFSIIVMVRPSVKKLFDGRDAGLASPHAIA